MPTLHVGKREIPYSIKRSRKARRQRIIVTPGKVETVAPEGHLEEDIHRFIHGKRRWVFDHLERMQEIAKPPIWPVRFVSGAKIPYRGRMLRLRIRKTSKKGVRIQYRNGFVVHVVRNWSDEKIQLAVRNAFEDWFRAGIKKSAESLVAQYAPRVGRQPKAIRVGEYANNWGLCTRDGAISLDWRLTMLPKAVLEYVIVHEMCHLKIRSHGGLFWSFLKEINPNWNGNIPRYIRGEVHV